MNDNLYDLGEVEFQKFSDTLRNKQSDDNALWIVFSLQNKEYAINASDVMRVSLLNEIVPVLEAPSYCPGVIWDCGEMILLLDLRALSALDDFMTALDCLSLPIIIVVDASGRKCGMIVDKIVLIDHLDINKVTLENHDSKYVTEAVECKRFKAPVYVIEPDNFRELELVRQDAPLDWKGRIDVRLLIEKRRQS